MRALPKAATWKRTGRDSNPRLFDRERSTVKPHRPLFFVTVDKSVTVLTARKHGYIMQIHFVHHAGNIANVAGSLNTSDGLAVLGVFAEVTLLCFV